MRIPAARYTEPVSEAVPIHPLDLPKSWQEVPIEECGETLVALSAYAPPLILLPQYSLQNLPGSSRELWAREGVARRLAAVAASLARQDRFLAIFDGWRPPTLQQSLFNRYLRTVEKMHPALKAAALRIEVARYVSVPAVDPLSPSPHLTGGAIDLTLCDRDGNLAAMGTAFDAFEPAAATRYFEDLLERRIRPLDPHEHVALENRRILFAAMTEQGFTSYPEEWWHFDYGNQFWGAISQTPACYGAVLEPGVGGEISRTFSPEN